MNSSPQFIFFGSSSFSVTILNELASAGFLPAYIVTTPDSPKGRGLVLTPSPVKIWAEKHAIPTLSPKTLRGPEGEEVVAALKQIVTEHSVDVFITASYGKIIPESILAIPPRQNLNVHPSLLPKLRGPSPIESAILSEDKTGVSIMIVDKEVDHGAVVAQQEVDMPNWPPYAEELEDILAHEGGKLLASVLPQWVAGTIEAREQDHSTATFTKKFSSEDGLIDLSTTGPEAAATHLRKIRAFHIAPGAYFFATKKDGSKIRVRIKAARVEGGQLIIERIVPEGKKEMSYDDFMRGLR